MYVYVCAAFADWYIGCADLFCGSGVRGREHITCGFIGIRKIKVAPTLVCGFIFPFFSTISRLLGGRYLHVHEERARDIY